MKFATTIGLYFLLLVAAPAAAQIAPYWIPAAGCELLCGAAPASAEYRHGTAGPMSLWRTWDDHMSYTIESYAWDGANGLCLAQVAHPGMDSFYYTYSPPLKVLELPLVTGAAWTSDSVRTYHGDSQVMTRIYHLVSTVVGPRTVDTGIGTLDVIEVTCELTVTPGTGTTTTTLLLNDQYGDVTNLISVDGCAVVATEAASWGSVKGLYR